MSVALVSAATILAIAIAFQIEQGEVLADDAIAFGDPFYWL